MHTVTYQDGRFYRDGRPYFVIAADYPYFRDRREHWHDRLLKMQRAGVNTITFYICWRHHLQVEGSRRWYDFTGQTKDSRDLVHYLDLIRDLGFYMIIKPGPFIHSELNAGGLPDLVSPTFNPAMPAAQRHHGGPATWTYDASILPAPFDPTFDDLAREYLEQVQAILRPYVHPRGPLIALQMNDETLYCTSNDPPWHIGYEPSGIRFYHALLTERYRTIEQYNRTHATCYPAFEFIPGPRLEAAAGAPRPGSGSAPPPGVDRQEDLLRYVDWAEYQWRLRRDLYLRYAQYLGLDLPLLTNYAGITPPIKENVPDLQEWAQEKIPTAYEPLYPEWWFAMNRVDQDADVFEYGMISWLGVAAYDRDVFDRYINTARRARGLNMEENWGFGTLYDARSRDPIVPFFQTLASVAGGATGYVIFVMVGTAYWDETLDRITKLQCPSFPSHAPVDEHGQLRPMYQTATLLNEWFAENGDALLAAELDVDAAYLLYAPYAAVSSWIPNSEFWRLKGHEIPRCGREGFEEFSRSLQEAGYSFGMFELESATSAQMDAPRALAIHSAFFMGAAEQRKLADYIQRGGRLFLSGELPLFDLTWNPTTILKEAVEHSLAAGQGHVTYCRDNPFAAGRFAEVLASAGIAPNVRYAQDMRAFVYRGRDEHFIFFFNFDVAGSHAKWVEFYGQRLELQLGSKTCGVLRVRAGCVVSAVVKGVNEVEKLSSQVTIRLNQQRIERAGDFRIPLDDSPST